jgi:hypothetical protein
VGFSNLSINVGERYSFPSRANTYTQAVDNSVGNSLISQISVLQDFRSFLKSPVDNTYNELKNMSKKENRLLTVVTLSTESVDSLWIEREFPVNRYLLDIFPQYVERSVENSE